MACKVIWTENAKVDLYYSNKGRQILLLDFFDTRQNPNKNKFD